MVRGGERPVPIMGIDREVTRQQIKPGTIRRILPYIKPYRWSITILLTISLLDAFANVANPLIIASLINNGLLAHRFSVVAWLSIALAGLAIFSAGSSFLRIRYSAKVGQGLIYDLRAKVFDHVQQQSIAFFTRSQTGSLVSRLNTDVIGAQQAITSTLTQTVSVLMTLILVIITMFYLSWVITLVALALVPFFIFPGKLVGGRLQRLTREQMQLNAEMGSLMNERFNVAGALLAKLYGRGDEESSLFRRRAGRVRDISVTATVYGQVLDIFLTLLTALTLAVTFGIGGYLVIHGAFKIGTLVALVSMLSRLYGPITQMSSMQVNILTALVSFDRVFEVLDLKPLVSERPGASVLTVNNGTAPEIEFDQVSFRYPAAKAVSIASLESLGRPMPERTGSDLVLQNLSFRAPAGKLTALVGPSGAGKTTITHLVPRLYDPGSGAVRIAGQDIRDFTLQSLHDTIGVVTQDAHLYHETIRANLLFANPGASEKDLIEACQAARIWDLVASLPDKLDTVVGDRGYRLSGGEKQRVALARLLLKAPPVVVLDEATAHLDSESEAAIQRALKTALAGRTSLVIAHRLSTIREADQILVIEAGQIRQRGIHDELLECGGLYAELYHTQFAGQGVRNSDLVVNAAAPDSDRAPRVHD
jgi:ATP-binding cassette subfamily B protein